MSAPTEVTITLDGNDLHIDSAICWRVYRWPEHSGKPVCQCLSKDGCRQDGDAIDRHDVVEAMARMAETGLSPEEQRNPVPYGKADFKAATDAFARNDLDAMADLYCPPPADAPPTDPWLDGYVAGYQRGKQRGWYAAIGKAAEIAGHVPYIRDAIEDLEVTE